MADTQQPNPTGHGDKPQASPGSRPLTRHQQLNKLYALPAPLRTFPLPTFVPHNPLSLFHLLYVWLAQTVKPEPSHFEQLYQGWFSPETRSVHVTDARSIRGLWEQGFYGKGSLSRSEPSWLNRERTRRGTKAKVTSEEVTRQRRAERQQTKWERARKEREAIDQTLLEEAAGVLVEEQETVPTVLEDVEEIPSPVSKGQVKMPIVPKLLPPIGPMELLSLPNSHLDLKYYLDRCTTFPAESSPIHAEDSDSKFAERFYAPPVGPLELLALPNSYQDCEPTAAPFTELRHHVVDAQVSPDVDGHAGPESPVSAPIHVSKTNDASLRKPQINESAKHDDAEVVGGSDTNDEAIDSSTLSDDTVETSGTTTNGLALVNGSPSIPKIKRQKSVRFSPTVEKTTFIQNEPPSPERAVTSLSVDEEPLVIKDQEHTQLTLEEAFFLSYGLGALRIIDRETKSDISPKDLFTLFRQTSHFPPIANPILSPDDPFMVNYVVYHHFRSLGWVVRSGIKFSVDYLLYNRGPVFTHAEFAILILPSYTDHYWSSDVFLQNYVRSKASRTWAWISCINRVITQVKKTLVLVYVDIPKPLEQEEEKKLGTDQQLERYKVREFVMKRWQANRMRD